MTIEKTLTTIPLFSQLADRELEQLSLALHPRQLAAGEVLFNLGDPGKELFIVKEGKLALYSPQPGAPATGQTIRIFTPGGLLGEMALIDQKPRSLSARAEEPTTVLALHEQDFKRLIAESPAMSLAVMAGLNDRIRYTTEFLTEVRMWVRRISDGNYQNTGINTAQKFKDESLAALAAEFAQMATQVKEREDQLRREVAQLRIEIDESKRKKDVAEIVGSDYYKQLKEKARLMRAEQDDES
jgi:CRP-like cAMP-binding protein